MKDKIIENVKRELKERQSSINKLCRTLGVNRNYINQLRDNTPVSKLKKISNAIGCNLANLFVGVQSHKLFLSIPFFEIIYLMGAIKNYFVSTQKTQQFSVFRFAGSIVQKSSLKSEISLPKSKGAGVFFTTFAPKIFHARIIISNLQLHH